MSSILLLVLTMLGVCSGANLRAGTENKLEAANAARQLGPPANNYPPGANYVANYTSAYCSDAPVCKQLGLGGTCCPTQDAAHVYLDCCYNIVYPPGGVVPVNQDPKAYASPACSANHYCNYEQLAGDCCPTKDGVFLNCCSGTDFLYPVPTTPPAP